MGAESSNVQRDDGDIGKGVSHQGVSHLTKAPPHSVFEEEEEAHQFFTPAQASRYYNETAMITTTRPPRSRAFIAPSHPSTYCMKCNKGPAAVAARHEKSEFRHRHLYVHPQGFPMEKRMDYEAIFEQVREQKEQRTQAMAEVPGQKRIMMRGHNGWIKNN